MLKKVDNDESHKPRRQMFSFPPDIQAESSGSTRVEVELRAAR
jgi:hypothetical protein